MNLRFRLLLPALTTAMALVPSAARASLPDTIGFTNRDRQIYGPALRYLVNDTATGMHAVWKDDTGAIFYNFRPKRGAWRWPDGTRINPEARNLGCLDVAVATGIAQVSSDHLRRDTPVVTLFIDSAPGAGVFTENTVLENFRIGIMGSANFGYTRYEGTRRDTLFYLAQFDLQRLGPVGPFPAFNLAVSKISGRWGCIWALTDGPDPGRLFLKQTPNNGGNWYATADLSESAPGPLRRSLLSGAATYDSIRIHLATDFYDGLDPHHSQIWHYCPYDTPAWHMVREASLPHETELGDLALAASRPSVGIDRLRHEYFIAWEEFDPANIDPLTGLARADIWAARSLDAGYTWGTPVRLTRPDASSKRFPFLAEVVDDTLRILYFADQVAGFWEQGQGTQTENPVICLRVPVDELPAALAESPAPAMVEEDVTVLPSGPATELSIRARPGARLLSVRIFDSAGREVAALRPGPGELRWGRDEAAGAYVIAVRTDRSTLFFRATLIR